ncbi:MAG: protein kinase, partial [Candidatus Solibacter usitatus]|nr:protein kinase [Candidatus Solibacter usitatus]
MYPDEQADQPTQSSGPASPSQFAPPPAPYLGVIVQNRYQIEKEIGHGGFGVVYLARDLQLLSKPVVVKVLRLPSAAETWRRKKFREEIEALTRIDHPGVVTVLDAGEMPDGSPYLVMQFVEGVPLRKLIPRDGMDLARAAELIRQAGAALNAA